MFKNRSKKLWLSLIAVITTLFIPIRSFADLTDVVTSIPVTIIKVIVLGGLAVTATFGLLDISQGIFSWASNPNLAGGVTTNEFVMQAWGVIRDFSNLFFILIIVGIGVATALRIKQYEVKKTLPRLIAIAILINFSPVICGVMIDTANIIMNFFFSAGQGGFSDMITIAGQAGDEASSAMNLLGSPSTISNGPYLTRLIVTVIMNLMGSFVLLLMSGLFIVRNIALWLLVILSPLAFLSAVSPKSGLFKKWSTQFISWTFIGVTASFFVYLSQLLIEVGPSKMMHYPDMESGAFGTSLMSGLIMNFIPIITLFMGYQAAMSSGAAGAGVVIGLAQKGLNKVKSGAKSATMNRLRKYGGDIANSKSVKGFADKNIALSPMARQSKYDDAGFIKKAGMVASRIAVPYRIRERLAGKVIQHTTEGDSTKLATAKAETDKINTFEGLKSEHDIARGRGDDARQVAAMQSAVEKGYIDKFEDDDKKDTIQKAQDISKKAATDIMNSVPEIAQEMYESLHLDHNEFLVAASNAAKAGNVELELENKDKAKQMQEAMDERGLWMSDEDLKQYGTIEEKIMLTTKKKDVAKIDKKYIEKESTQKIIQDTAHDGANGWGGNLLAAMEDKFGIETVNVYNKVTQNMEIDKPGNFEKNNSAKKWIRTSPGATAAGFIDPNPPEKKDKEKDKKIEKMEKDIKDREQRIKEIEKALKDKKRKEEEARRREDLI